MKEIEENLVLSRLQQLLENQTAKGLVKYGTTVEPLSLSAVEWIDHTCEEIIDQLVYLQVLRERLINESKF